MRINVVYNNQIGGCADVLSRLEEELITRKVEFQTFDIDSLKEFGDFTIVIGGDGTLLKAARFYTTAPVLGINLGRLGFLSQAGVCEIETVIDKVLEGSYSTEERLMLQSGNSLALNDFVIKGCKTSRTSKFYLERQICMRLYCRRINYLDPYRFNSLRTFSRRPRSISNLRRTSYCTGMPAYT